MKIRAKMAMVKRGTDSLFRSKSPCAKVSFTFREDIQYGGAQRGQIQKIKEKEAQKSKSEKKIQTHKKENF